MNHDLAYCLTAAWAHEPTVTNSGVWTLGLCGVVETGGNRVLHIVARGRCIRWLTFPVPSTADRLTSFEVTQAIAAQLDACDGAPPSVEVRDARVERTNTFAVLRQRS